MTRLSDFSQGSNFLECYKIIQHFLGIAYFHCLCNRYQGWHTEDDYLAVANFYCCICQLYIHYTIDELNAVKRVEQKLTRFYKSILKDLEEIKKVEPDINFLDGEIEFKFRNWQTGEESQSNLID